MSKLVYIAGPFRGPNAWAVEQNIREAEKVGFAVAEMGGTPVIPHSMYRFWDGTQTDEFWLNATLDLLRRCDAIVLLPLWHQSAGARAECNEAERLKLAAFYWYSMVERGKLEQWLIDTTEENPR